ncbi:MAG: DnaJ domain-containing protein [Acidimicrobiia bacterium]|nr:DnaJ domain-containing protein [Acidimicrobiia bacterium]
MRREWLEKDYYATLGVGKDASQRDIKKAYRKLAQEYHPDANPDNGDADTRFKDVNEAYDVLGDAEQRKEYDHAREMGYFVGDPGGAQQYVRVEDLLGGGGSPFQDLIGGFGDLFGGGAGRARPQPGRDLATSISVSFHEAISGTTREVQVDGKRVKFEVPKGVADGARVRLRGKGGPGAPNGDLYVTVGVADHPIFGRKGRSLTIEVPLTYVEATLGAEITVPTLQGSVKLRIPAGTAAGKTFKVKGRGITDNQERTGDLLVTVTVTVPSTLTDEERSLLEKLADQPSAENPRKHLGV